MRYVWFVVAGLGGWFVLQAVDTSSIDGDLDWQRYVGSTILATHRIPRALGMESLTAAGARWTHHEWIFSTAVAASANDSTWPLFAMMLALCAVLALLFTAWRAVRRGAAPRATALTTLLTGIAMCSAFDVRAQVLGWPLLALLLLSLDSEGMWMWAAVPVTVLWSNLHASALLAPLAAAAAALGRGIEDRAWTPRVRRSVCVTAALAAAVCCTPFGIGLPLYAIGLIASPMKSFIGEWQPVNVKFYGYAFGALPLLIGAATLGIARGRRAVQDALIFSLFALLLMVAARHTPLFAIAAAPLVARAFTREEEERERRPVGKTLIVAWGATGISFVSVIVMALAFARGDANAMMAGPKSEIVALEALPGEHRVFCEDFAWCGALLGVPGERVFLDGRDDPYPLAVWQAYHRVTTIAPEWNEDLRRYGVDAVLTQCDTPLDQALALTGRWREAQSEGRYRLWLRR